jgi:hypothetical protein
MIRCAFCGYSFYGEYPHKTPGIHTVKCEQCRRAFIIHIVKRWWGYQRKTHIR